MSASIWSPDGDLDPENPSPDYLYKRIWLDLIPGQTLVNFAVSDPTFVYTPGLQALEVGIDGLLPLQPGVDYAETSSTSITLTNPTTDAGRLYASVGKVIPVGAVPAEFVTLDPSGFQTKTNVQALADNLGSGNGASEIGGASGGTVQDVIDANTLPDGKSIAETIAEVNAAFLVPKAAFDEAGIILSNSDSVVGNNAVILAQSICPIITLNDFSPSVSALYLQGNTDTDGYYFKIGDARGARLSNIYGANAGFGGIDFNAPSSSGVHWLDAVFFEDITGIGFNIRSNTSKIKATGVEAFGKIDYTLGLGKPRAGSIGWRQNTPVVGSVAVGGHQVINSNMEAFDTSWWLTDAQLSKYSNCIADGCSQYGLRIDGTSTAIEFADFFCGTTAGIYIGGASSVTFNGLMTVFTGVIPPWGKVSSPNFYNDVATFYDLTVADTAKVFISGWRGNKRVSVASGATLNVDGGQKLYFNSQATVTASSTVYLKLGGGTTAVEDEAKFRVTESGVMFLLKADSNDTPSSGSHVYTVRTAGADTTMTCSTASGSYSSRLYSGGISVVAGQTLSIKLVTGPGPAAYHNVFFQLLPV